MNLATIGVWLSEALGLPYGIKVQNPRPLNAWAGPYDSVADALATVPAGVRWVGMDVVVIIGGQAVRHVWKAGTANNQLVPDGGGSSRIQFTGTEQAPQAVEQGQFYFTGAAEYLRTGPSASVTSIGGTGWQDVSGGIGTQVQLRGLAEDGTDVFGLLRLNTAGTVEFGFTDADGTGYKLIVSRDGLSVLRNGVGEEEEPISFFTGGQVATGSPAGTLLQQLQWLALNSSGGGPAPTVRDVYGYSEAKKEQVLTLFQASGQDVVVDVPLPDDTSTFIGSRIPDIPNGVVYELVPDKSTPLVDENGQPVLDANGNTIATPTWMRTL